MTQHRRLGRTGDAILGGLRDGQKGPLVDILGMLEEGVLGTSWSPIFTGWKNSYSASRPVGLGLYCQTTC